MIYFINFTLYILLNLRFLIKYKNNYKKDIPHPTILNIILHSLYESYLRLYKPYKYYMRGDGIVLDLQVCDDGPSVS